MHRFSKQKQSVEESLQLKWEKLMNRQNKQKEDLQQKHENEKRKLEKKHQKERNDFEKKKRKYQLTNSTQENMRAQPETISVDRSRRQEQAPGQTRELQQQAVQSRGQQRPLSNIRRVPSGSLQPQNAETQRLQSDQPLTSGQGVQQFQQPYEWQQQQRPSQSYQQPRREQPKIAQSGHQYAMQHHQSGDPQATPRPAGFQTKQMLSMAPNTGRQSLQKNALESSGVHPRQLNPASNVQKVTQKRGSSHQSIEQTDGVPERPRRSERFNQDQQRQTRARKEHLSILLVGKSGSGKSSVGNALLSKNAFEVGSGFDTTTNICQVDTNDGLTVADTPDLSSVIYNDRKARRILQPAFDECSSKFDVILLVMRLDVRLTEEEIGVANLVQRLFGDQKSSNIVLVFTHSEWVESDEAFRSLMERQRSGFPALDKLMRECGEQCVMLNGGGRFSSERLESERKKLMEVVLSKVS